MQGERTFDTGVSATLRILVLFSYQQQVRLKGLDRRAWQDSDTVFRAFAVTNNKLRVVKIYVFYPKPQRFHQS